jgi:serine/threonine protein phosphatase 1
MKYFLFSDVHGEYNALITSLEAAGFDLSNKEHVLIGLGDYFDRGSQNEMVLVFLKTMLDMGRIKLIRGNHDDMLLNFLRTTPLGEPIDMLYKQHHYINDIIHNGMNKTVAELAGQSELSANLSVLIDGADAFRRQIKDKHPYLTDMLVNMTDRVLIDNYTITHAGFSLGMDQTTMRVDNWCNTERMIEKHHSLLNQHRIYIFGHWHAEKLNKKFNLETNDKNKFVYKNFIGIDAMTNITRKVTIHIIETETNIF